MKPNLPAAETSTLPEVNKLIQTIGGISKKAAVEKKQTKKRTQNNKCAWFVVLVVIW